MAAETSNGGGIAIIVICSLLLTLNFACLIYCFWKRNYLPLKACNMTNMNLTYTSMVMTFIGSVNIAGFSGKSKVWSVCAVSLGWLGMALGVFAFIALFQMRVYTYLNIFILNRRATGVYFIIPVAYVVMISIIYAIIAFILPPTSGFAYISETNACFTNNTMYFIGLAFVIVQAVVLLLFLVKIRKMECCFHESRNAIINFIVCAVFGFILLALGRINFSDDKLALAGILKIFFIVVPQQIYFYMNLGPTIYHLFIHANEYNDKFINTIEERGLAQVYELVCKCPLGEISNMSAEGKTRGISMDGSEAGSNCGSEYSVSSNFSGNVPGPDNNQPQHPAHHTQTSPNGQTLPFYSI
ncbi:hypothetical protein EV178_000505 [Coemansia sp. RSA 1646]|nr:hypothetical protein EV178_000505 [Coemansia sp. RSA 1646]